MNTKKCTKCGIETPLTEFHKRKASKDGYRSGCKACLSQYRAQNKERKAEYDAQYRAQNKEKIAQYYAKNREKLNEYSAQYRAQNKEKIAEYRAQHYVQNKEKIAKRHAEKVAEQPNCTYKIKNLENNKVYIGETTKGELRWKEHLIRLRGDYHINKPLQEDFNKYGKEAFEWTILKEFESEDRDALILEETKTIQRYLEDGVELYNMQLTSKQLKMLEEDKKSQ